MPELPIPAEYTGSLCEIKTMENALVSTGRIKEIAAKYIKISNRNKDLEIVDYGTLLKINVFNTQQGFRVIVGNVYTSSKVELSIVSIVSLVETERRNFFRVDMNYDTKAVFMESSKASRATEVDISIKDMSLSGIRFVSKYRFETGMYIKTRMTLNKKKDVNIQCRIVRIISEEVDGMKNYGCEIIHDTNDNDDTDIFCSFLFQKQREFLNSTLHGRGDAN